jgi:hypothetical protein
MFIGYDTKTIYDKFWGLPVGGGWLCVMVSILAALSVSTDVSGVYGQYPSAFFLSSLLFQMFSCDQMRTAQDATNTKRKEKKSITSLMSHACGLSDPGGVNCGILHNLRR